VPYTIDGKIKEKNLTASDRKKWDQFVTNLKTMDPKAAAESVGTASSVQYKKLTANQYQFRLSGSARVSFVLDGTKLKQVQVGGHT
jgi:G:T/U-mismatch repair DNA glycosylase